MALTFVERTERFSTYRRPDGSEVHLSHGFPVVELVEFDWDDFRAEWDAVRPGRRYSHCTCSGCQAYNLSGPVVVSRVDFLDAYRAKLVDPDAMDVVAWCEDCDRPGDENDFRSVASGDVVCESCFEDNYYFCGGCSEFYSETTYVEAVGESFCESCLSNSFSFCDECEDYYHDDSASEHSHGDGCCESPGVCFTVRNDGESPLRNDTRVTVTLPAGTISPDGIREIWNRLYNAGLYSAADHLHELGDQWQTREGNFTKRLSRLMYNKFQLRIPPDVLSGIGCVARDHSTPVDFPVEVTRDLNLSADDFYHGDSCWWGSYHASRCALKTNGGFGLRTFDKDYPRTVTGRAWVMPLHDVDGTLVPTFDTETPDAYVVFNCYGKLANFTAARIISHMAGWTYNKVLLYATPMYVNDDRGYLVAPEEIAGRYKDAALTLDGMEAHSDLYYREARELVNA